MQFSVHHEHPDDAPQIRAVVEATFSSSTLGHHGEADLVERLRDACPEALSLVAKYKDRVVGHVLFSPAVIEASDPYPALHTCPISIRQRDRQVTRRISEASRSPILANASGYEGPVRNAGSRGMGLGPMAVSPELQRQGIGRLLITRGVEMLEERGCSFVCVFGWPDYYGRFGFRSARHFGIDSEFGGAADGTFQVLWLGEPPRTVLGAIVRYRPEFSSMEPGRTEEKE